jgi:hypothetical protein
MSGEKSNLPDHDGYHNACDAGTNPAPPFDDADPALGLQAGKDRRPLRDQVGPTDAKRRSWDGCTGF